MTRWTVWLGSGAAMALLAMGPAQAQDSDAATDTIVVTAPAAIGAFGIDLTARDTSASPGSDFERYAAGKWIDATEIPADRPSTGTWNNLRDGVQDELQRLITEAPAGEKYGALYASFMDEKAVERAGLAPLMRSLADVRAIADKSEFARFLGASAYRFGKNLFD